MKYNDTQTKIKHLRWQCRRGMLELDLLLLPFFDKHYLDLSAPKQALFVELLSWQDPDLYQVLVKRKSVDAPLLAELVGSIVCGH